MMPVERRYGTDCGIFTTKTRASFVGRVCGFASVLPRFLGIEKYQRNIPVLPNKLLTICGSINAITLQQMDVAEQKGVSRIRLICSTKT